MKIPLTKPDLSLAEATAVSETILSGWLSQGKTVEEFEKLVAEYTGARYAIAFCNGTAALHATLLALGIGKGDEVIVPSFTFFSTVSSIVHAGATPVFADIDPHTFTIDPDDAARRITARTKAILPVHYGGGCAEMNSILQIADSRRLWVIEDAAEAIGSTYGARSAGTLGTAGMFSFTPTKNITTGEGGVVVTREADLQETLRLLRNHGQDRIYHHVLFGYNYRMTEMQAALGIVQLRKLSGILSAKQEIAARLTDALSQVPGLQTPRSREGDLHSYMLYTVCLRSRELRDALMAELRERGIETRVYFPPVHLQPVFRHSKERLPVTEDVARRCVSLPCYATMTPQEADYLTDSVRESLEQITKPLSRSLSRAGRGAA